MAYGARLESVLGASPRGFESPSLRQADYRTLNPQLYLSTSLMLFIKIYRNISETSTYLSCN